MKDCNYYKGDYYLSDIRASYAAELEARGLDKSLAADRARCVVSIDNMVSDDDWQTAFNSLVYNSRYNLRGLW